MEEIVVKTEEQPSILLFYVDENQSLNLQTQQVAEITKQHELQELQVSDFMLTNVEESADNYTLGKTETECELNEEWKDEDVHKLLQFYLDNLHYLEADTTTRHNLWDIACKRMLYDKHPSLCEVKFISLKNKYAEIVAKHQNGISETFPHYDLCHQLFENDDDIQGLIIEKQKKYFENHLNLTETPKNNMPVFVMNKPGPGKNRKHSSDEKVELMLNLYLKYKETYHKYHSYRGIWDVIAMEIGEEDADYWHKRFLNFKQHYIRMLHRRAEIGPENINWPYMKLFDQIFKGDERFNKKFSTHPQPILNVVSTEDDNSFNETERTVLVKYYFDCFHEFQDPTIPNKFLWHEIGRLLEKNPNDCKKKYKKMKTNHLSTLMECEYDWANRIPTAIILDNIIANETKIELSNSQNKTDEVSWSKEKIDELVEFFYDNIEMFKDSVGYYVCWNIAAYKLKMNIYSCKLKWEELTALYKSILEDKKENPDMQINWKYIDTFDRIFDYGMDTNLLEGYENAKVQCEEKLPNKVGAKRVVINDETNGNYSEDEEFYDENDMKRSKRSPGESKAFKILEFYQKNKDKFSCSLRKKLSLWEVLAKQIGITAIQCAHRFRNLKQVYTGYVQREINKPDMPILWPYYALCKKVFGYRAIKSKLKNGKMDSDDAEEWAAKEIKQLINYFATNFDNLHENLEDHCRWTELSKAIGKTEAACSDKFLELRKSYRKLKTMKSRNPEVKVSWKYFNMMDEVYSPRVPNVDIADDDAIIMCEVEDGMDIDDIKSQLPDDEDYEYIIVIPEDQEKSDGIEEQMVKQEDIESIPVVEDTAESKPPSNKWNKTTKKKLLMLYLKYLRTHKGKEIDSREMWKKISSKLMKPALSCRRILIKLKNQHRLSALDEDFKATSPYYRLIEKILMLKPKFAKIGHDKTLKENVAIKDVTLSNEKVEGALKYYLENLEEFLSPKFEKKYVWMDLANSIKEPVSKVFNKINYLKNLYNSANETEVPFLDLMQEIVAKEVLLKDLLITDVKPVIEGNLEEFWSEDEVEHLLSWYLIHLDKFKNPKYVRSYLWMEASEILNKSPLVCSKKMSEIRTQYRNMVRETPEALDGWRFYNLCQRIYGTGKRPSSSS